MNKLIVGLTGGIACGKTTVSLLFNEMGANVLSCDCLAHLAIRKGSDSYKKIIKIFGKEICNSYGTIKRKSLARIVFNSKSARKELENIIHPFVFKRVLAAIKKAKGILIIEIPLLYETGFEKNLDRVIVVYCRYQEQLKRLRQRDNLSLKEARLRIKTQMSLVYKKERADYLINTNNFAEARRHIREVWKELNKKQKMRGK